MKRWRINWKPLAVIAVVIGVIALFAPVVALSLLAVVLLMIVVEGAGMGGFTESGIGDDALPVLERERVERAARRRRPYY